MTGPRQFDARFNEEQLEAIEIAFKTHVAPAAIQRADLLHLPDYLGEMLAVGIRGYVYGKRGQPVTARRFVKRTKFPRWVPGWLRNRWSEWVEYRLDATPMTVFPEMPHVPDQWGRGHIVMQSDTVVPVGVEDA